MNTEPFQPHLPKSTFEKLRIPLSIGAALIWAAFLLLTQTRGFESAAYKFLKLAGFFLIFVAVIGRLWCTLYIGGRKDRELCPVGPYSLCRNPLYLFSFVGTVGVCLAAQNLTLTIVTAVVFLGFYRSIIIREEERLKPIFGSDYLAYVARVPRFLPRWHVPETEITVQVNIRSFTNTLKDASWFLMAIIAIELIEDLRTSGVLVGWILSY
ncbi:isoprenylcysteine carboxylmethyltransferase family protein [Mesorhizobium sp. WSM2561]|uniref:methyltransferase family protein n=1 Tax=Mesorhizobium sp. WSM2561 TaxID=1040985 RepID=UPI000487F09D|nr:isoprenylcysteine carboxylmethyltransferase family protein [Mesorhizobium sp. WSM2561]